MSNTQATLEVEATPEVEVEVEVENTQATPEVDLSQLSYAQLSALLSDKRKEIEAEKDEARKSAQDAVELATQAVLEVQPVSPSQKEGSTWVGSILGGFEVTVDGRTYSVQLAVKDIEASKARKEANKKAA